MSTAADHSLGLGPEAEKRPGLSALQWVQLVLALLSVPSMILNIYQAMSTERDHRYVQKLEAREKLETKRKERRETYLQHLQVATHEVQKYLENADHTAAFQIRDQNASLEGEKQELVTSTIRDEQDFRSRYDKACPVDPESDLRKIGDPPYLDRVFGMLSDRLERFREANDSRQMEQLLQFAADIDQERTMVTTTASVNVRSLPVNALDNVVVALPPGAKCYVLAIAPDRSWVKVRGAAPGSQEGWVYSPYLSIPPRNVLRQGA